MIVLVDFMALILCAYCVLIMRIYRSAVAPASLWLFAWAVAFSCAAIWGSEYTYTALGLTIIFTAVAVFPLGCLLATHKASRPKDPLTDLGPMDRYATHIQIFAIVMGIAGAFALARFFGQSLLHFSSVESAAASAFQNNVLIESGEETLPTFSSILFAFVQLGFVAAGMSGASKGIFRPFGLLLFAALTGTAFLWTFITIIRSYMLVGIGWYVASYVATKIYLGRENDFARSSTVIGSISTIVVLIAVILGFQSFRMGDYKFHFISIAMQHMRPWLAGYIPGFCVWYQHNYAIGATASTSPLDAVLRAVGLVKHQAFNRGNEFIMIGMWQITNALTAIKLLVSSMGALGAVGFCVVMGYVSQIAYEQCRRQSLVGWAFTIAVSVNALWSPNYWFFNYGSRVLALMLIVALAAFAGSLVNHHRRRLQRQIATPAT